jgi:hypothetical protein
MEAAVARIMPTTPPTRGRVTASTRKLEEDLALQSAYSEPGANLAGAFGDGNEHHVQ